MQCFAQVAGGQQVVGQIAAAEQQNVDVAGELAVLKAIVEQMDANLLDLLTRCLAELAFSASSPA